MSLTQNSLTVGGPTDSAPQASLPLLTKRSRRRLILTFFLGSLLAVGTLIIAVFRWNFAFSHYGPVAVWNWAGPFLILSATLFLIGIIALVFWQVRRFDQAIANPSGLTILRGRKGRTFPWERFTDLRIDIVRYGFSWWTWGNSSSITVSSHEDRQLRFRGSPDDLEKFTKVVKEYLYPLRIADYREQMNSQQVIDFGALQCSPQGLTHRKQLFEWDSLQGTRLEAGQLILTVKRGESNKTIRIQTKFLSNPDLCAQIISNIEY
jgi:hypothetical protein